MTKILLFFILYFAFLNAHAINCNTTSNTIEMNIRGQMELNKLDAELNDIYKRVLVRFEK